MRKYGYIFLFLLLMYGTAMALGTTMGSGSGTSNTNGGSGSYNPAAVAITGGTIDGVTIGGTTSGTGTFSTLNFTNALGTTITATTYNGTNASLSGTLTGTTIISNTYNALTATGAYKIAGSNVLIEPNSDATSIGVGAGALSSQNASNKNNTAIGANAGSSITSGSQNTIIGQGTNGISTSSGNTFIGYQVANFVTVSNSTAIGSGSSCGTNGVCFGNSINSSAATPGGQEVMIGGGSNSKFATGANVVAIGYAVASTTLTTGANDILIGVSSAIDATTSTESNAIHIGGTGGDWVHVTGTNTSSTAIATLSGSLLLPNIASDAAQTDATICEDTTNHKLFSGSGTLGICLGTSSARYKTNIIDLSPALQKLMALRPVNFNLDAAHGDPNKTQYGFIAEDAVTVYPDLVGFDKDGKPNTFDYLGLVAPLVKSVQEQQAEIYAMNGFMWHRCAWPFGFLVCAD